MFVTFTPAFGRLLYSANMALGEEVILLLKKV